MSQDIIHKIIAAVCSYYIKVLRIFLIIFLVFDADIEPLQTNLELEEGYCKALLCRLRFRKVLAYVYKLNELHPCFALLSYINYRN